VLVIDEQSQPGGQIYRSVERINQKQPAWAGLLGADYLHGAKLVQDFRGSGASYMPGTLVWNIEPGKVWHVKDDTAGSVSTGRVLLATGAIERPMARPGWTLPGVMGAGGAQVLLKTSGLVPSSDAVLLGNGPLLYLLAAQIVKAAGTIQAIVETVPASRYIEAAPHLAASIGAGYLSKGLKMLLSLQRQGVKVYRGASSLEILGDSRAEGVRFQIGERSLSLSSSTVILHEGVIPNQQMTRLANCEHRWDHAQRCFVASSDKWGNTSAEGLMIAGDGAGIAGALAAEESGRLAALEAAHALGRLTDEQRDRLARPARARHDMLTRGRRFLEVLYAPSEIVPRSDDTIVCRCEEVTAGEIRAVVSRGGHDINQVKSYLRCGMGPCQGRMCGPTVNALIAAEQAVEPEDVGYFRIRPPLKPLPLQALANSDVGEALS
jgi:NADPH-dependent 2,4-dienoyl-CoA reductase/sulfur reductase-like enzyme